MSRGDRWLLILPLALTAIGVIMVYSSSAILGMTRFQDPNHYLYSQVPRAVLGIGVLLLCARVDLRRLEAWAPVFLGAAAALLAAVWIFGHMANGATRWLKLGMVSLQPTDLARIALVVFLARWLKRRPPAQHGFLRGLLPPLGIACAMSGLVLLQPNLSSAGLMLAVAMVLLFVAEAPLRHLAVPVAVAGTMAFVALETHPYMMGRVQSFVHYLKTGELNALGSGFQLDQSLIAIGSGGWIGRGLGGGLQKFLFLPEAHTDFIFSILAEELGFIGATALLVLFGLLVWRGIRAAAHAADPFAGLLAAGLTAQLGLYAIVNLAVATGLAPTTGLPLPFVSYGGSALLANMAAAGLLYRVSTVNASEQAVVQGRWNGGRT